jgi:hypothetical protein
MNDNQQETAVVVVDQQPQEMSINELKRRLGLVQQTMKEIMKVDHHYGLVPGCGKKPSLLKPGSEILCTLFRLAPKYVIESTNLPDGHREYKTMTSLYHIDTGIFIGQGVGTCSTMESKYRFRTGSVEYTDKPVPGEYWNTRKENPNQALQMLGGKGFTTKKHPDTKKWVIAMQGEKVENSNPADEYNTILKMSKKRSLIDAVLNATAASDCFTQDLEDIIANQNIMHGNGQNGNGDSRNNSKANKPNSSAQPTPANNTSQPKKEQLMNIVLEFEAKLRKLNSAIFVKEWFVNARSHGKINSASSIKSLQEYADYLQMTINEITGENIPF